MDIIPLSKIVLSLSLLLIIMYIFFRVSRKLGKGSFSIGSSKSGPSIDSVVSVDENTKIVTFCYESHRYILSVSKNHSTLIDKIQIKQLQANQDNEFKREPHY